MYTNRYNSRVTEVVFMLYSDKMHVIEQFEKMSDEQLVEQVHQGNTDALDYLITKYRLFVKSKAKSYFLIGADKEDIVQEGSY